MKKQTFLPIGPIFCRLIKQGPLLFLALFLAAQSIPCAIAGPQLILGSGTVESDKPRRPFLLRTELGDTFGDQDMIGRFTILYFGYTYCPDVCPTSLFTMAEVLKGLGEKRKAITALFISVDPDRDKLEDLRDYTDAFDDQIIGLTGPKVMVDAAVDAFNARYEKIPSDDNDPMGYSVDHTASMAFIGPDARLVARFGYGLPTGQIIDRIQAEIDKHPGLLKRLLTNSTK